jgi:hypothetical protein
MTDQKQTTGRFCEWRAFERGVISQPWALRHDRLMTFTLMVPDGLTFADLALEREPVTHRLLFLPAPLGAMCLFNGLDP